MDRLISLVLVLGIGGFFAYNQNEKLKQDNNKLRDGQKTAINSGVLTQVQEFTFSKITSNFNRVEKIVGPAGIWKAVHWYEWDFQYNFGVRIPFNWQWNPVDDG